MTQLAIVAGGNMLWMLAFGLDAVMTAVAIAQYRSMIDPQHRRPGIGAVAVFAAVRGEYVCRILAFGDYAIVAADTVSADVCMIEYRARPGECSMAIVAVIGAADMAGRLAHGSNVVMTSLAWPGNRDMVHLDHRVP